MNHLNYFDAFKTKSFYIGCFLTFNLFLFFLSSNLKAQTPDSLIIQDPLLEIETVPTLSGLTIEDTLSLAEVYEVIFEYHPLIQKAKLIPALAIQDIRKARGMFDPTIMGDWTEKQYKETQYYQKIHTEIKIPTILGFDIKAGYENNSGVYLGNESTVPEEGLFYAGIDIPLLRNLIFDERRATLRKAQVFAEMAEAEQRKEINKLFFGVAKDYWEWYAAYQSLLVAEEGIEVAEFRFEGVKAAYEYGKYRAIDTTEALMELQKRKVERLQALVDFEKTRLALSGHVWSEDGVAVFIKPTIAPSGRGGQIENFDLQSMLTTAAEFHPELLKQQFKLNALKIDRRLYQFSLMPQLDLSYKPILYPRKADNLALTEDYKFGLTLYAPLFLRKERASFNMARIKIRQQELDLNFTQRNIQIGVEQAYIQVNRLAQMVELQRRNAANALVLRDGEQTLFELGKSTVFLINYRERYYLDAKQKLIQLEMKYAKAKAELMWNAGQNEFVDLRND
ncbi:TolC family protein [Bernardetia sp.]|uniref:TolC family protein n=1 Tax=Bernardetia sp. TaxID=1937974 RepID=UPI0025BAAD10|nr:TolC family protein [Bernardetia sp.]